VRIVRSGGTQFENFWSKAKVMVNTLLKYEDSRGVKVAISLCGIKNRVMTARCKNSVSVGDRQCIGWSLCWSGMGRWTWHTWPISWFTVLWLRPGNVTFTFPLQCKLICCSLYLILHIFTHSTETQHYQEKNTLTLNDTQDILSFHRNIILM
jgi:hypothetical protein